MKKNLTLVVVGVILSLTLGVAHQNAAKAPVSVNKAEVVLGHRIGPGDKEMLVYAQ